MATTDRNDTPRVGDVKRTTWVWTDTQRRAASSSEDAFDAAALEALPARDGTARREGDIWVPPGHDT